MPRRFRNPFGTEIATDLAMAIAMAMATTNKRNIVTFAEEQNGNCRIFASVRLITLTGSTLEPCYDKLTKKQRRRMRNYVEFNGPMPYPRRPVFSDQWGLVAPRTSHR